MAHSFPTRRSSELSFWAMRKGLAYAGRADQMTLAQFVTVKK